MVSQAVQQAALAICDDDFELVAPTTAWRYDNHSLPYSAVLWECNNQISFQSLGYSTDWHGSWTEDKYNKLVLKFQYEGRTNALKTTVLYRCGYGLYEGYDYRGRAITMTRLRAFMWDGTNWH